MSKKSFGLATLLGVVLMTLACAQTASAMGGDYGQGNPKAPTWNPAWPVGLTELVNQENRVGGFWVNSNDWFDFTGDTAAFNTFLAGYSKLQGTPLTLVLHAGKATVTTIGGKASTTACDWQVGIVNTAWTREAVEDGVIPKTPYIITLNLWLGGQVDLTGLKVPANIEVKIEAFVAQHRAKQE